MASTATETKKTQETPEQSGSTQSATAASGTAQQGSSQNAGTSPQSGGTSGQGSGSQLSTSSRQDQGLTRRGSPGTLYFPSTAEFFANPFGVMRRMHEEMDRAFAEAWSGGGGIGQSGSQRQWAPAIDVTERQGNLVVHAELPGVKPEDVQIEIQNDTLILSGSRQRSEEHEEQGVHRRERVYGSFYREIPLPEGTDTERARAQFNHGVLEITVPLPQRQSQSRRIQISSGEQAGSGSSISSGSGSSSQGSGSPGSSGSTTGANSSRTTSAAGSGGR